MTEPGSVQILELGADVGWDRCSKLGPYGLEPQEDCQVGTPLVDEETEASKAEQ